MGRHIGHVTVFIPSNGVTLRTKVYERGIGGAIEVHEWPTPGGEINKSAMWLIQGGVITGDLGWKDLDLFKGVYAVTGGEHFGLVLGTFEQAVKQRMGI